MNYPVMKYSTQETTTLELSMSVWLRCQLPPFYLFIYNFWAGSYMQGKSKNEDAFLTSFRKISAFFSLSQHIKNGCYHSRLRKVTIER